jgi:hypothetical protein
MLFLPPGKGRGLCKLLPHHDSMVVMDSLLPNRLPLLQHYFIHYLQTGYHYYSITSITTHYFHTLQK